ncbi:hypothetical protein MAPG_10954 [Magnaporthiopsis poae ATCC 64411]|uniref:Peptidase A1 domain-containing protein n=1 Tax=Magnaporthiopsis poae (strain ATCC 64411 / 73-15) TaxID=644358 RepID=A0A0C4EDZ4_MAGP6|nr:hypothetical protein MAPG_10954 [Magnaporthiopsis poae ATCC 64411]
MPNTFFQRVLLVILVFSLIPVVALRHSKQDAVQVLSSIEPIPGVLITVPPQQPLVARVSTDNAAKNVIYQQSLALHVPEPGDDQSGSLYDTDIQLPSANPRSASVLLGALHRKAAAAAAADPANDNAANSVDQPHGYENITGDHGLQYTIPVSIDNVTILDLLVDTATADLWAVAPGAQCLNVYGWDVNFTECQFGSTFPKDLTFSYGYIPNQHLFMQYPDGEMASGTVGYSDIEVGGITVLKQEIGLVNRTYWIGNKVASGVVGLGYPTLSHIYRDNETDWLHRVTYPTLFTSMVDQGLVEEPMFGIALGRNGTTGVISWGGMPDVPGLKSASQSYVPILVTQLNDDPFTVDHPSFYTIVPDGFKYGSAKDTSNHPYIIDAGTPINYLPRRLAEAINKSFAPTAEYNTEHGRYYTNCDATPPAFSVMIGGSNFIVNPADMIIRDRPDPHTLLCPTTISLGGTGPYILGAAFLNNVAVGFDVQAAELTFVSRPFY